LFLQHRYFWFLSLFFWRRYGRFDCAVLVLQDVALALLVGVNAGLLRVLAFDVHWISMKKTDWFSFAMDESIRAQLRVASRNP
jgi:hypothetical protein